MSGAVDCEGVVDISDIGGEGGPEWSDCGVEVEAADGVVIRVLGESVKTVEVSDNGEGNLGGGT